MAIRKVVYVDPEGRKHLRGLPDGIPDAQAGPKGIPLGPPSMKDLGLPLRFEIALHNTLFERGLFDLNDVKRRPDDVRSALASVLKMDQQTITRIYAGEGAE